MTELEEKEFNRRFDSWLDSEYDKYCEAEFDKYCQTLEQEKPKQLTQDVFKDAPEWANFLVVNAYGIGFFTDVSPYLATWRAANGWVQSSYSKGLIAFAGKFDVDDWQKFKLKRLIGSENK